MSKSSGVFFSIFRHFLFLSFISKLNQNRKKKKEYAWNIFFGIKYWLTLSFDQLKKKKQKNKLLGIKIYSISFTSSILSYSLFLIEENLLPLWKKKSYVFN